MSSLPITSLNALLNKAALAFNTTSTDHATTDNVDDSGLVPLEQVAHYQQEKNTQDKLISAKDNQTIGEKIFAYLPVANGQQHTLHHVLKGLGYMPDTLLESMVNYLNGPSAKQYPHADAHLRLIIGVNSKLKTPLHIDKMPELRERFATDAVAMQDSKVWKQASPTLLSHLKLSTKSQDAPVNWEDKSIANADDGDMAIRCYQAGAGSKKNYNPDETVMLFFHGGGFCIGDLDTHHEFCHTVCAQTGWSVVSVDYRLAPEYSGPTALRDCLAAYGWLAKNSHTLGALPSRIVIAGDSAGGGLSTLIAQQITAPNQEAWLDLGIEGQNTFEILKDLPAPIAQMPLYPVTDIETDYPSWELYGEGLLLDHADVAVFDEAFLMNSPLSREHILISPMLGDNQKVCPTFIVASELDVLRDQAFAYAEQLKTHDIEVQTRTILGAPHGFIHLMSVHTGLEQETISLINEFATFVQSVLSKKLALAA